MEHVEGSTRLLVQRESLVRVPPPTSPVFFNPEGSVNRDISVSITSATPGESFCDSMCGVGARGIRVAKEVKRSLDVTLVDFNEAALTLARRSAKLNRVEKRCEFSSSETSSFLHSRFGRDKQYDYVDVDPFGTPARQIQAAISATSDGGIISVTATDTATLCGVYPNVSKRRYGAASLNNKFHHESGIRILFAGVARESAKIDAGIRPIVAHSTKHYIRVYARIEQSASKAEKSLSSLGLVIWCRACGNCEKSSDFHPVCMSCGAPTRAAGPLWLGDLTEPGVVNTASKSAERMGFETASKILGSLSGVDDYPPWSFSIEEACSRLRVPSVPEAAVYECLKSSGYSMMRTPFEKLGVKTNAPHSEFMGAVKESVEQGRVPSARLVEHV